ncbi:hypothetical protein [Levilactobacillus spicheri]|uniref:Uncharacterized protein n=1 Tax=Levilactobacillus spicheri TaxID=216463 RepID=A0ABQ0WSM7_9LACO|nr:hypothetical protein [Levilactobacillus spicheri]GEO68078.1 hypothetical protein LSP04_24970 [Levilactobacillus spicheri]
MFKKLLFVLVAGISMSLAFVSSTKAMASTYRTVPSSLRGHYIGDNYLVHITKHWVYEGSPQADIYAYKISSINKSGRKYRIHCRVAGLGPAKSLFYR